MSYSHIHKCIAEANLDTFRSSVETVFASTIDLCDAGFDKRKNSAIIPKYSEEIT